ncbi:unnamed protein product [Nippostrongylus brasiliensis]|uniref:Flavin_Reduct domain-containing protein n=1 Tax=Nippostrongylus brasiliensis TaxID=27835 RepID=A0A0N4Y357_NIPBR|nr:unnamed protein product [Nippostrongylus brasiliensis]
MARRGDRRVDEMDDRRVHDESNATDIPRRYLLSTDNKSPVVALTYVGFPALGFLQCDHMVFYVTSSFEKSVEGFASKTLLINPDWQSQQEELPEKFVAKAKDVTLQIVTVLVVQKLYGKNGDENGTDNNGKNNTTELEHMLSAERLLKRGHNVEIATYKLLAKIPEGKIKIPQGNFSIPLRQNSGSCDEKKLADLYFQFISVVEYHISKVLL